ncbi:UNVERIFIED_ORG: hypothetical protein ABIB52_004258 [Arthrobacter sp. UYCu721]
MAVWPAAARRVLGGNSWLLLHASGPGADSLLSLRSWAFCSSCQAQRRRVQGAWINFVEESPVALVGGAGKPTDAGAFVPVTPARFLDTRDTSAVDPDAPVSFQVSGNGIPANAAAVVFNLTVTEPKSFGFVTAYGSGTARPNSSNVNFNTGQTIPNAVTVPVGSDGKVTLFNRSSGTTHLIADVSGYYLAGNPTVPGAFVPVSPARFLDTRDSGRVGPDAPVSFQVGGRSGIPANAAAVVFNLTVTEPKSFGFATAYGSGTARPNSSNVNFNTGQTIPNAVTVPVGADGKVTLFNRSSGTTHLIADVSGYYLAGNPIRYLAPSSPSPPHGSWTPATAAPSAPTHRYLSRSAGEAASRPTQPQSSSTSLSPTRGPSDSPQHTDPEPPGPTPPTSTSTPARPSPTPSRSRSGRMARSHSSTAPPAPHTSSQTSQATTFQDCPTPLLLGAITRSACSGRERHPTSPRRKLLPA